MISKNEVSETSIFEMRNMTNRMSRLWVGPFRGTPPASNTQIGEKAHESCFRSVRKHSVIGHGIAKQKPLQKKWAQKCICRGPQPRLVTAGANGLCAKSTFPWARNHLRVAKK